METYGIEKLGITSPSAVYRNLTPAQLTEAALRRGEGTLSDKGALVEGLQNVKAIYPFDLTLVKYNEIEQDERK